MPAVWKSDGEMGPRARSTVLDKNVIRGSTADGKELTEKETVESVLKSLKNNVAKGWRWSRTSSEREKRNYGQKMMKTY